MPKRVDHDLRRAQIIDSLVRCAAREGLHAITMRAVAAEAGVSLRLVQYYFQSKSQMMQAALESLESQSVAQWAERITASASSSARARLEAFLAAALPTDEQSRTHHLLWTSYAVLSMTDTAMAEQPFIDGPNLRERELAQLLRNAIDDGELPVDRDPDIEAGRLLTLSHGLGTSVLVGQRTITTAQRILQYHLDQMFASPAL
ncbi:TetR/AcrR family transcriptional regulator [Brachybacterium sacelli]|uniref:AcrR family transcriptional regulator n=1 Tax=Brachybacterium sacelli TaxID=173364 RepID=A0ABS4X7S1_9MICO|nr:TetR/AcrR family transcriptional regulator [Brachybacterium sacelli]MBP2384356.1 AcrR family transcriptional regulator [Brachybacterium sacelli]